VYDMRDAKEIRERFLIVRVIDEHGNAAINTPWFGTEAELRHFVSALEFGYAITATWVGPSPVVGAMDTLQEAAAMQAAVIESAKMPAVKLDSLCQSAKRWCKSCGAHTQQDRLSEVSWMCG